MSSCSNPKHEHLNGSNGDLSNGGKMIDSASNGTSSSSQQNSVVVGKVLKEKEMEKEEDDLMPTISLEAEEDDHGNVEYKRQLIHPTPDRFQQLVTQLKWRLGEGQGEAIYEIGVDDDGTLRGLSQEDLALSMETLRLMAKELSAEVTVLCERKGKVGTALQALIREMKDGEKIVDVRMAVCGNVDSGKSTMIGVLITGKNDNGRGAARLNVFAHKHEIESGRTSSISEQIMGFDGTGNIVNYKAELHSPSWSDIANESCKVVSFFDLAGHEKYLKTTISGMTGHLPDYCLLLVGANMGITRMTREHLGLAIALKVPVIVVVTKIDIAPENVLQSTVEGITRLLKMKSVRKTPYFVKTKGDVVTAIKGIANERFTPIFKVSNVHGDGLELVRQFLNLVPPRMQWGDNLDSLTEVIVDESYFVSGVGTVIGGTVISGRLRAGETLLLGPDGNGLFKPVAIKSIHNRRQPVKEVLAGKSAGFAVKKVKRNAIRKGMVLLAPAIKPKSSWFFTARVVVLYHSTTIQLNYQPVIQCLTMRQSAAIVYIDESEVLRTGDKALVGFRFLYRPEYIKPDMRLVFREGRCKGLGIIENVFDTEEAFNAHLEARHPKEETTPGT